jgi:hypothetical protein
MSKLTIAILIGIICVAGCGTTKYANVLFRSDDFCDVTYGTPLTVLESEQGSTRLYRTEGMTVAVGLRSNTAKTVTYAKASRKVSENEGRILTMSETNRNNILAVYAPIDEWAPLFGEQGEGGELLVTRDRTLFASIEDPYVIIIGSLADIRNEVREQYPNPLSARDFQHIVDVSTNVAQMSQRDRKRVDHLISVGKVLSAEELDELTEIYSNYNISLGDLRQFKETFGRAYANMLDGVTNLWESEVSESSTGGANNGGPKLSGDQQTTGGDSGSETARSGTPR